MIINHSRSIPKKWQDIARVFEALGDEQRQRILLSFEKGEELNITQLVDGSRLARTSVAHHLKVLHQARVLNREKRGKEVYYWINKKFLDQCFTNVTDYLRDYV